MLSAYLHTASLLVVALLFGGLFLFSGGFAVFLFRLLPPEGARMLLLNTFPSFYPFVMVSSGLAMALSWRSDSFSAVWMAFVMLTVVAARQLLMPAINRATDLGYRK
jgi:hypothetical protein